MCEGDSLFPDEDVASSHAIGRDIERLSGRIQIVIRAMLKIARRLNRQTIARREIAASHGPGGELHGETRLQ
jgi:hypothetical protein